MTMEEIQLSLRLQQARCSKDHVHHQSPAVCKTVLCFISVPFSRSCQKDSQLRLGPVMKSIHFSVLLSGAPTCCSFLNTCTQCIPHKSNAGREKVTRNNVLKEQLNAKAKLMHSDAQTQKRTEWTFFKISVCVPHKKECHTCKFCPLHSQKADRVVSTNASIYTAADRMSCVTWSWTFDVIVNLPGKHSVTVKLRPSGVTVAQKSNQSLQLSSVCHCQAESYRPAGKITL